MAAGTREGEYLQVAERYTKPELEKFSRAMGMLVAEMEQSPFRDCLGTYYTELAPRSSALARGEFYTLHEVSSLMARMTAGVDERVESGKPVTIMDPCCGSGGMILAFAEQFAPRQGRKESRVDLIRATCIDVNPIAADMCYINTTLWGIPSQVYCGNSLTMNMTAGWRNLHWLRVGEEERLKTERMVGKMREVLSFKEREEARRSTVRKSKTVAREFDVRFGSDGNQITFGFD